MGVEAVAVEPLRDVGVLATEVAPPPRLWKARQRHRESRQCLRSLENSSLTERYHQKASVDGHQSRPGERSWIVLWAATPYGKLDAWAARLAWEGVAAQG